MDLFDRMYGGTGETPAPPAPSFREKFQGAMQSVSDPLGRGIGAGFETLTGGRGTPSFLPPGTIERGAGKFIAESVIPQTPEQAALMALFAIPGLQAVPGLATVGKTVGKATSTMPRMLTMPPVVGAGTAAATGGDVGDVALGAGQGVMAGGMAATTRGMQKGVRVFRMHETQAAQERVTAREAPKILDAIMEDVPALRPGIVGRSPGESLILLRDPANSRRVLSRAFAATEQQIAQAVPVIDLPQLGMAVRGQALAGQGLSPQQIAGNPQITQFSTAEAFEALRRVAADARRAQRGSHQAFSLKQLDHAVDAEFRQALVAQGRQDLADLWKATSTEYRKGLGIGRLLEEMGATPGTSRRAIFDPDRLRQVLMENVEDFPPSVYPELYKAAFPGVEYGAGDVAKTIGGQRVFFPGGGPIAGGAINLPKFLLRERVGITPPPPTPTWGRAAGAAGVGAAEQLRQLFRPGTTMPAPFKASSPTARRNDEP